MANFSRRFDTALPYIPVAGTTAMPYVEPMQTVVETKAYISAAAGAGMSDEEMQAVVDAVAADPRAGAIMPRCGGARRLRVAKPGSGKSGGYRVIACFGGEDMPVFC